MSWFMVAAGVACLACPAGADEWYGRACLVVEALSPEEPPRVTTTVFDDASTPGPGKRLALHLDASVESYALAAAFNDTDRRLTNGWPPQLVELKAWEERRLPLTPVRWEWTSGTEAFDVYVVFLERTAEGLDALQPLVAAMQDPKTDPALRDLQAKKLREQILGWMTGQETAGLHAGAEASAWGGTLRGEPFPWPKLAKKAGFGAGGRGVLLYRHGR